jgi:cation diffusion facilitator family transporter
MHLENVKPRIHDHIFDEGSDAAERGTRLVMWITAAMMVVEVVAGWWFNSMALLADGWHMSSHAMAIGLSAFAYSAARRHADDRRFAFGTWKIEVLGGFASAVVLSGVALLMVWGSLERILSPQPIHYQDAIVVAVVGLLVNIVCARILGKAKGHHDHEHVHDAGASPVRHDLNLKSAYVHVVADAATSILAIVALAGGWAYGWSWLDPAMGIAGAVLVAAWARNLLVETGKVLLDREMDHPVVDQIRGIVETGFEAFGARVTDLHVWRVGKHAYSCAMSVRTHDNLLTPERVRGKLAQLPEVCHSTIEIHADSDPAGREVEL